ncbi:hypothetical protein FHR24_003020 [Wenyingzhuangia heitensis]|uniref:Uncharacterized protein n=1 Tax=Wenyingzhuangia heitensis TaxID=1487859 RepID=A0ABX0UH69_9FLAO|nr:hypothetical protein [Wenyingzhuangia heitensis]NIJ46531.1 hypothetical protein [Wenyingzhuangia heitensis]
MVKEKINVNNIDGNIVLLKKVYDDVNNYWTKEINTKGDSFDFDSQDIYCHLFKNILLKVELIEKIDPELEKEERNVLLESLKESVSTNINLYDKYISSFEKLPRQKLMIDEFRRRNYSTSDKTDHELELIFNSMAEPKLREEYFNSSLYKEIGFLKHNYHEEIYHYSLYIIEQIENNFKSYYKYNSNYLMIHHNIFFNMGIIHLIEKEYSGFLFEEITELELYKILNLQNSIKHLKIKDMQKFLYIIDRLNNLLDNKASALWLPSILKEIRITKKYYLSKYRSVAWKGSSDENKDFANKVGKLF